MISVFCPNGDSGFDDPVLDPIANQVGFGTHPEFAHQITTVRLRRGFGDAECLSHLCGGPAFCDEFEHFAITPAQARSGARLGTRHTRAAAMRVEGGNQVLQKIGRAHV